jgi:hypothetical protein
VYFGLLRNISVLGAESLDIDYTSVLILMVGVVFSIQDFFAPLFTSVSTS